MIEDDFYCTLKLKYSGEEIFAKVAASDEGDRTMLLVSHPVIIEEVKMRNHIAGYKFEPWIKTSSEDMFILKDVVDYFVVCEADKDHGGNSKKYNFDEDFYNKNMNKIIYIQATDLPDMKSQWYLFLL